MIPATEIEPKLKVFISYSRADLAFADELVEGLEYDGRFQVSIDRHSIIEGEDWKARLGALIADADTIVFILSPESAQSVTCDWEVEHAHELSKRILPALWRPLGQISAPTRLAALNYVRFDNEQSFMSGLKALVKSLNTDIEWLREHTRLLARAHEWVEAGRSENRLLSGSDITLAKRWVATRPKNSPEPTDLHLTYIKASEAAGAAQMDAELKRQAELAEYKASVELQAEKDRSRRKANRMYAVAGASLVAMVLFAGWQWYEARQQSMLASKQAVLARAQQAAALRQKEIATGAKEALYVQNKSIQAALKKVTVSLCKEAKSVTQRLGSATDPALWDSSFELFWTLYWGPMIALETLEKTSSGQGQSNVESAMVKFGNILGKRGQAREARKSGLPQLGLQVLASEVSDACSEFTGAR